MQQRPLFSKHERGVLRRSSRRMTGWILVCAAVLLMAALISYDAADPSMWSATWRTPENWLGGKGAVIADMLMRFFGLVSFAAPALLALLGARILAEKTIDTHYQRLLVAPLALLAACGFASSHATAAAAGGGLGGIVGDFVFGVIAEGMPLQAPRVRLIFSTLILLLLTAPLTIYVFGGSWRGVDKVISEGRWHMRHAMHLAVNAPEAYAAAQTSADGLESAHSRPSFFEKAHDVWARMAQSLSASAPSRPIRSDWSEEPPLTSAPCAPDANSVAASQDWPNFGAFEKPSEENRNAKPHHDEPPLETAPQTDESASLIEPPEPNAPLEIRNTKQVIPHESALVEDAVIEEETSPAPQPSQRPEVAQTGYTPPPLDIISEADLSQRPQITERALSHRIDQLQSVLEDYGVRGEIIDAHPGPVVTLFELEPAPGLKASRVIGLAEDIARSMSAVSARVTTVPGRNVIGIELPNEAREMVMLRDMFTHPSFAQSAEPLTLALGKNIAGEPITANLARMPHLLIAGTTGSGKSVAINTMILSLIYRLSPDQVRMIMIDPKMLELSVYNDIPHLLSPVVTDPKKAVSALKWVVREMEQRYQRMAKLNVRGLESYNQRVAETLARGEKFERVVQTGFDESTGEPVYETQHIEPEPMPYVVVVVDEMADLMMVAGKEIEHCIQRLAQMARASGIHLIMATQRPSVDVITGTIKANFPIRMSFQVTSKIDSRTILGEQGAEQLLGRGDMLYCAGGARITRVHAPFVSDEEVEEVTKHLKGLGSPSYKVNFDQEAENTEPAALGDTQNPEDSLYDRAVALVVSEQRASTSFVQRRLQIGYNRAARIVELMEEQGVVSPANHVGKREVLIGGQDKAR